MTLGMPEFDLGTEKGRQDFQDWITKNTRNELNSYARQVLDIPNAGLQDAASTSSALFGNLDGGLPNSNYGGITPIDLGGVT